MNVVIVDDEPVALNYAKILIEKYQDVKVVAIYENPLMALEEISVNKDIDVLFLDVSMPEINGLEFAKALKEKGVKIKIVFLTAYDQFALPAFEVEAVDYLLKPIDEGRLTKTIARLKNVQELKNESINKEREPKIKVRCLGKFSICFEEQEIKWQSVKSKELMALLFENYQNGITGVAIIEELWAESDMEKGNNNLYTTIFRARKSLEKCKNLIKIVNRNRYYFLECEDCYLELADMEKLLKTGDFKSMKEELQLKIKKWYAGNAYLEQDAWGWSVYKKEWLEKNIIKKFLIM